MATINGTFNSLIAGTLSGTVATPGAQGPAGPAGSQGPAGAPGVGVPAGGLTGQILSKASGTSYDTAWTTLTPGATESWVTTNFLSKAGNLSGLTDLSTARDNLQLGTLNSPTFAGVTVQGAGSNVANLGATFLTLNHTGYGQFTIQPSSGITFPDTTVQTTAFSASVLLPYAPLNSPLFTGDPRGPTAALGDNDTSLATTAFVQQELLSGTANARNLEVYVRNQTGSTLAAGAIVYINGATGNRPTVTLAQANNDANSAQTFGFVKTAIANNGFGYVIVRGELENIDTSALTEGVQLYLSPTTPGAWTTTKPSAPQHLVYVGIVVRSHPTQGVILVAVQNGYELNELHDVAISSPTNGQVLKYDSATNLWKNQTDSSGVAWGGITGTLSAQTDLQTALNGKYSTSNPAGYITSSALTPYLLSTTAASTYYPLTNPSGYITSSALTGYATESWVTSQGYLTDAPSDGSTYGRQNGAWVVAGGGGGSASWGGITGTLSDQTDLQSALDGKADLSGDTFSGDIFTPTVYTNNAQERVLNALSSEIFNGMNLADHVTMNVSYFSGTFSGTDPEAPISNPQTIDYSVCCPAGLNHLVNFCTANSGQVSFSAYLVGDSSPAVTWQITEFYTSGAQYPITQLVSYAELPYGNTYDIYLNLSYTFPGGGSSLTQRSRMKVYSFTV